MHSNGTWPSISPQNRGLIVNIVTWLLLVATALAVIIRTATKQAVSHGFGLDDFIIITALIVSVGETVMVSIQTGNGLGQYQSSLTTSQMEKSQQFDYAANLLFVANMCLTKISLLFLLWKITPEKIHRRLIVGTGIVTMIWTTTAEIAAVFQCHLPRPWSYLGGACFDRISFWNYVGVVNIFTDVALILLCFELAWNIKISFKRRLVVAGFFAPRVLVVAAIVVQLVYANRALGRQDLTHSTWQLVLSTQFVQNLSVVTACVPSLKPFFDSLETGFMRNDDLRRQHSEGMYNPNNERSRFPNSLRYKVSKASSWVHGTLFSNKAHELEENPHHHISKEPYFGTGTTNMATAVGGKRDSDAESYTSRSQFVRMTKTWTVESEPCS